MDVLPEEAVARAAALLGASVPRTRRLARTALPAGLVRSAAGAARAGRTVVLTEGATDAAVVGVLLPGATALGVGGKHVLVLAAAVVAALGARCHVLLDGDAEGWRRAANPARTRAVQRRATAQVLTGLAGVGVGVSVLPDALEAELARWPAVAAAAGPEALDKRPARYRELARRAVAAGDPPPPALAALRDAVAALTPGR